MRVEALMVLHYGLDYVNWAIRSVYDQVERFHVVYSAHPSHGSRTGVPCPESRAELRDAVMSAGRKVQWHDVDRFWTEGPHRDYALSLCAGDLALVVDADEVWDANVLASALKFAYDAANKRTWLVNFTTPWRSHGWIVTDNMWPVRVVDLRQSETAGPGYIPKDLGEIYHFGYAVRDSVMAYKMRVHGHLGEWRPDWYEARWGVWPPVPDCHPTCLNTWYPRQRDRRLLPQIMWQHPFFDLEPIP